MPDTSLIRLRPFDDVRYASRGRLVVCTGRDGFIGAHEGEGFFAAETRLISRYRYRIDGQTPQPVALSNVEQHTWLGHYILVPPGVDTGAADEGSGMMTPASEYTLELRLARTVGAAVREDVRLTNFTQQPTAFELSLEVDADFADLQETTGPRRQHGTCRRTWHPNPPPHPHGGELVFAYEAEHASEHGGAARLARRLVLRVSGADTPPAWRDGRLTFAVTLPPRGAWAMRVDWIPEGQDLEDAGPSPDAALQARDRRTRQFLDAAAGFEVPADRTLAPVVAATIERARLDLAALRLFDLDIPGASGTGDIPGASGTGDIPGASGTGDVSGASGTRDISGASGTRDVSGGAWTVAAGLPIYTALYGRDTLTAAWQSALLGPEMMLGTLDVLARLQGAGTDDWRDEQPGRMLHEAHPGPLKVLGFNPFQRYYGSVTTSAFYPVVVSALWHWTGDAARVRPFVEPALRALRWLDAHAAGDDGFYYYRTRSPQGVRHQAWKDSPGAIVDAGGAAVEPPIATCEEQGFVYLAKVHLAEVLFWLGDRETARRLFDEARRLKARFDEAFWVDDLGFYAMGLDARGRPVRSVGSNPGHCLAAAIVDAARAGEVADRLFAPDLFSGWGIRTLSADHPAYNPYSYHRGSVWPVEQGTFALAFARYGLHAHTQRIARALFEAAALFEACRLPEVFSGHARAAGQPFPAFYPQANAPQAWSASAVFCAVQALLGLYPYAPLKLLLVDPHLPDWLPGLTLRGLRVGEARVTLRFYRAADGSSSYHVDDLDGPLHVVRQPSPWSLTAGAGERIRDVLTSLLPGK